MKSFSKYLLLILLVITVIVACKKKKDPTTDLGSDPNDPNNPDNTPSITCKPATLSYSTTNFSYINTYYYNSNGKISSITTATTNNSVISNSSTTYTYDGNENVTKKDFGGGSYITYEYTSGKISKYSNYASNALTFYSNVSYQSDKIVTNMYNNSNQLYSMQEDVIAGDNFSSSKYTYYDAATGVISAIIQYDYSNFDDKYSFHYLQKKYDPSLLVISKNNYRQYTSTTNYYNTSGAITSTNSTTYSIDPSYNTQGALTHINASYTGSSSGTYTNDYTYTDCN